MTKAIQIHENGGPEVLRWEDADPGTPGDGEALVRHSAVGLNYIDVYLRTGLYPAARFPFSPGFEGAGTVEAVGDGVSDIKVGDRVAYAGGPPGAYAEARVLPADRLVRLPDGITDEQAAGMMLQGMTVQYLLRQSYPVKKGDTILVHAAAGGVGLIACQWAKHLGATVIGTVGTDEKAELARGYGCDHPIVYTRENFTERVKEITDGAGVPVVYDSIGKDTWTASLDCLAPLGHMISFGSASGPVDPFGLQELASRGSLYVQRPTLFTYAAKRDNLLWMAGELFDVVKSGAVKIEINQQYALSDAAQAHKDLEARKTTGSTVLTV